MKNEWMEFFKGRVTVRLSGKGNERFLNMLARNGYLIWNVKRKGPDTIQFSLRLADAFQIRRHIRGSGLKLSFISRKGFPFLIKRMFKNSGFLIGGFLFLFLFMLLSNIVWGIEIKGAKPETEYQIRKELDKIGVKPGKLMFFLDSVETIQKNLTNEVNAITWVGVELRGTTYHLRVVEKNEPKEMEYLTPRHLIAKKEAVVVNYFIEKGKKLFDVNDRVVPGQMLVSGLIGREGEEDAVAAKGEVWGETLYKGYAELPLSATFQVFNGLEQQKHFLRFGGVSIPVWGFGKVEFKNYETETTEATLKVYKWKLPVAYINKTMREREEVTRVYTKDEAVKKAAELAKLDLKKRLDEDAIIKEEKILHRTNSNGKVKLSILYTVIENIAIGQPIIQGD